MIYTKRLKKIREECGYKQKDLAEVLHLSITAISHYENGTREPDIKTLIQIAQFLDVSLDYLIGLTDVNIRPSTLHKQYIKGMSIGNFISKALSLDAAHRLTIATSLQYAETDQFIVDKGKNSKS